MSKIEMAVLLFVFGWFVSGAGMVMNKVNSKGWFWAFASVPVLGTLAFWVSSG